MYQRILLSVDLHDEASWEKALPRAVELCRLTGAELHLLTVTPDLPMGLVNLYLQEDSGGRLLTSAQRELQAFVSERVPKELNVYQHVDQGSVYASIIEVAEEVDADLIVMASHRPAMRDYLLGPNAARVVRHAARSVLVVRN